MAVAMPELLEPLGQLEPGLPVRLEEAVVVAWHSVAADSQNCYSIGVAEQRDSDPIPLPNSDSLALKYHR